MVGSNKIFPVRIYIYIYSMKVIQRNLHIIVIRFYAKCCVWYIFLWSCLILLEEYTQSQKNIYTAVSLTINNETQYVPLLCLSLRFITSYTPFFILGTQDCWEITFATLNRFCQANTPHHHPPMKNTYPFYIVFQVFKDFLIRICKIQPPDHLLLFIYQCIPFFENFHNFIQHYLKKKDF